MSQWTRAGHAAVYFSSLCAATPVRLRPCRAGEAGSVVTNYPSFGETHAYEWNAVPLNVFLYGVEEEDQRPLLASHELRDALQEHFRERFLAEICPGPPCSTDAHAHWRDTVAESFVRGMYIFVAHTTTNQDLKFIADFNAAANVNHYSGISNNCADFAMRILNSYFPHSAKPDHLNDFGITSPKAIAKSFAHYAARHPELLYHVIHIPQLPGSFKSSGDCRKGTEVAFRSKRWFFPMLLRSHELLYFAASYWLTGRFNPQKEFEKHPSEETAQIEQRLKALANSSGSGDVRQLRREVRAAQVKQTGTDDDWRRFRMLFREDQAGSPPDRELLLFPAGTIANLARGIDLRGEPEISPDGNAWLNLREGGPQLTAGLDAANVNSTKADPRFAYQLMLVRLKSELKSEPKRRESLPQFKKDWLRWQSASLEYRHWAASRVEDSTTAETAAGGQQ